MKAVLCLMVITILCVVAISPDIVQAQEKQQSSDSKRKVNINIATIDELKTLPDINSEIAQAIFENRPYKKAEDLLKVKGMNQQRLKKIRSLIEVKALNVNSALLKELIGLPGIDREIAEEIINNRPYKIVEELLKIQDFSEELLDKIRGFIEAKPAEQNDDPRGWKTRKRIFLRRKSKKREEGEEKEEDQNPQE